MRPGPNNFHKRESLASCSGSSETAERPSWLAMAHSPGRSALGRPHLNVSDEPAVHAAWLNSSTGQPKIGFLVEKSLERRHEAT
jgi:hypothetical protein